MKKTAGIVGGALAVIAAAAALITNAKTIADAANSAFHWAKGENQSRNATPLQRIKAGDPFQVKLYKTFGDLGAGQIYYAWYTPSGKKMTVTGFAARSKQANVTNAYSCPEIDKAKISLWGHSFSIDSDEIVDAVEGRSGRICFDGECK